MRRLLLIFLCSIMLIAPAFGEESSGLDLKAMSTLDLLELRKSIDTELDERGAFDYSLIKVGTYIGGKSITPGLYEIQRASDQIAGVEVYVSEEDLNHYKRLAAYLLAEDRKVQIVIEEGTVVSVLRNDCLIRLIPEEEKPNWMP